MPLRRKLETFSRMSGAQRLLVAEAVLMLGLARLALLTMPFRRIAPCLARAPEMVRNDAALATRVREAVTIAARNAPRNWNAVCLPQAMAAKAMLARRGYGSSLRFGASYDGRGKLTAHAWLEAGGVVIFGAEGVPGMVPLARFG